MISKDSTVLIIDDMKMARFLIIKGLNDLGYTNYKEAEDGEQAWNMLNDKSAKYGLILSDWNMPKMNGYELLVKIRASEKFKKMPFIMITAEADTSQIKEAVNGGATDYMVKPFSAEHLKQKLDKITS
jgi:two-component system, chemotaxis family, chemotaxis protein CheY